MGLHHRKLLSSILPCVTCPPNPSYYPPPEDEEVIITTQTPTKHIVTSTYLIISFSIVATALLGLCCYAIYAKFFSALNTRRRTTPSQPQTEQDFPEQEQDPAVDHHIWYIRTTGLHQSVIGAITVCKYKKGEGLVEGTECSVCLTEFEEDESLRLLPKCNHAFHLPCIDTWLRSHTNCPMCRAPIVTDPTRVPSMDPNAFASTSFVEIEVSQTGIENTQNSNNDLFGSQVEEGEEQVQVCETQNSASEVVTVQPRRSVSLDSSDVDKITLALATVMSGESRGSNYSKRVAKAASGSSSTSSIKRSRSFNAKHLLSWYGRSQRKTNANAPLRSF